MQPDENIFALSKKEQEQYFDEYFVVEIPDIMSKKFIAYCSMKRDLDYIFKIIELLRTNPQNMTIVSSLTFSIITLYGKCFTDASKNSYPKLEPRSVFKKNNKYLETHDFLMELRHEFIAHRGKTDSEIGNAFLLIPKVGEGNNQITITLLKQIQLNFKNLLKIENLVKFVGDELDNKIQKSKDKLHNGMFNKFTGKELSTMIINNSKDKKSKEEE